MSGDGPAGREIHVRVTGELPGCSRCGRQALMTANVPHGWDNPGGPRTQGTIPVALCATCDLDDPAAGPLITYLLVHEQITRENMTEGAALIQRWAESLSITAPDADILDEEYQAWQRGDL